MADHAGHVAIDEARPAGVRSSCYPAERDANTALIKTLKKEGGINSDLHAGQPVNADGSACGVTPELDELLDGEYAS